MADGAPPVSLPSDAFCPTSRDQRAVRATLHIVTMGSRRMTSTPSRAAFMPASPGARGGHGGGAGGPAPTQSIGLANGTDTVVCPYAAMRRSAWLSDKFDAQQAMARESNSTWYGINVGELEMSTSVLRQCVALLSGTKRARAFQGADLVSALMGCCQLRARSAIDALCRAVRSQSAPVDLAALSPAAFSFLLEAASLELRNAEVSLSAAVGDYARAEGMDKAHMMQVLDSVRQGKIGVDEAVVRGARQPPKAGLSSPPAPPMPPPGGTPGFGGVGGPDDLPAAKLMKRERILSELTATERTYVGHLDRLCNHFGRKLIALAEGTSTSKRGKVKDPAHCSITPAQANAIIGPSQALLVLHRQILAGLQGGEGKARKRTSLLVADVGTMLRTLITSESSQFVALYTTFCSNYLHALTTLTVLRQNDAEFNKWIDRFSDSVPGLPLESLLIAPVQRVPRYRMFLDDLLRHTTHLHADFLPVGEACEIMHWLCATINHSLEGPSAEAAGAEDDEDDDDDDDDDEGDGASVGRGKRKKKKKKKKKKKTTKRKSKFGTGGVAALNIAVEMNNPMSVLTAAGGGADAEEGGTGAGGESQYPTPQPPKHRLSMLVPSKYQGRRQSN